MAARPVSVEADGNVKVAWVPAIANTAAPTAAELTAGGVVDLSGYLTSDGFTTSTDEQVVTDDRLNSTQTYERRGRFVDSVMLAYVYRQQEAGGTDNLAFTTLTAGAEGFIVARWGTDNEAAFAASDVVDVYPAQCGIQSKQAPEANSVLRISQKVFISNAVQRDVAVTV